MNWTYKGEEVTEAPEEYLGFIYEIWYEDGTRYIGKKNMWSEKRLPPLRNGKIREGAKRSYKQGKGRREYYDLVKKETNWKKYKGSSKNSIGKVVKQKEILAFAKSKRYLTYLEVKYLFIQDALEDPDYLNDNILGKFYDNIKEHE